MSSTPESLPTSPSTPEVVPPAKLAGPEYYAGDLKVSPKSEALLQWEKDTVAPRRKAKMEDIDRLLDYHLADKEYVDAYDNQKAKALDAMKSYIRYAYAVCMAEAHKSDVNSEGRALWNARFFKQTNDEVNEYISMITAFLIEAARKSEGKEKGKINLNDLFDLADRGRDIYVQIAENPEYGKLLRKINTVPHVPLDDKDYDFIITKFPKRDAGEMSVNDTMKLLEASGAITILYAMNPEQRMEFAKHIIENKPPSRDPSEVVGLITSLGSSGFLKAIHLEELYPVMRAKGIIDNKKQEKMESTIKIGQAKADMIRKNIDVGIRADMDKNQAIKFTEPRYIGGAALVAWRSANMALSLVAYRNDLSEYLKSPWMLVDIAGIVTGSALMGNPTVLEWIKKNGGKSLEDQAIAMAMCEMIINKPRITDKYFTRAQKDIPGGKKETGMVELLTLIRREKTDKKQPMNVKIEEMLTFAEGKDSKTKNHEVIRGVSPELIALLQEAKSKSGVGEEGSEFIQYANVILASRTMQNTDILKQHVAEMKRLHGIK